MSGNIIKDIIKVGVPLLTSIVLASNVSAQNVVPNVTIDTFGGTPYFMIPVNGTEFQTQIPSVLDGGKTVEVKDWGSKDTLTADLLARYTFDSTNAEKALIEEVFNNGKISSLLLRDFNTYNKKSYETFYPDGDLKTRLNYNPDSNVLVTSTRFSEDGLVLEFLKNNRLTGMKDSFVRVNAKTGKFMSVINYNNLDESIIFEGSWHENGARKECFEVDSVTNEMLYRSKWSEFDELIEEELFYKGNLLTHEKWSDDGRVKTYQAFYDSTTANKSYFHEFTEDGDLKKYGYFNVTTKKPIGTGTIHTEGKFKGENATFKKYNYETGVLFDDLVMNANGIFTKEYRYDFDGDILSLVKRYEDGVVQDSIEYKDKKLFVHESFDADGTQNYEARGHETTGNLKSEKFSVEGVEREYNEYSENGVLILNRTKNADGITTVIDSFDANSGINTSHHIMDDKGNNIERITSTNKGNVFLNEQFEKGVRSSTAEFYKNTDIKKEVSVFNENGGLTNFTSFHRNGEVEIEQKYTRDGSHLLVDNLSDKEGNPIKIQKWRMSTDSVHQVEFKEYHLGTTQLKQEISFDKEGRGIEDIVFNKKGKMVFNRIVAYTPNQNTLQQEHVEDLSRPLFPVKFTQYYNFQNKPIIRLLERKNGDVKKIIFGPEWQTDSTSFIPVQKPYINTLYDSKTKNVVGFINEFRSQMNPNLILKQEIIKKTSDGRFYLEKLVNTEYNLNGDKQLEYIDVFREPTPKESGKKKAPVSDYKLINIYDPSVVGENGKQIPVLKLQGNGNRFDVVDRLNYKIIDDKLIIKK